MTSKVCQCGGQIALCSFCVQRAKCPHKEWRVLSNAEKSERCTTCGETRASTAQTDTHPSDEGEWTKSMSHFASEKNYWKARAQHYEALYRNKSEQLIRFVNRDEAAPAATQGQQSDAMDAAQRYVEERDFISNDNRRIAGEAFLAGRASVTRPVSDPSGKEG